MKPSPRKTRIEHGLRDALTELIAADVKDPRVRAATMLTVTRVELNVDNSVARVYVSIVSPPAGAGGSSRPAAQGVGDDATIDGVLAGLAKAAGFLRGPVARRLNLMRAPELRFVHDATVDIADKLAAIVREDEERARAAGRDPDKPGGDT